MPDNNNDATPPEGEVVRSNNQPQQPQMSEAFQAGMMQIFGEQETYKPTKSQVDKMLSLQEKGMDYTHKERTMYQPRQVLQFSSFVLILLFIVGLVWLILAKAPQYTGEVVASVISLIGGGLGGYGYGSRKNDKSDE